jgi:Mrp family chromosome partitioning ATPase
MPATNANAPGAGDLGDVVGVLRRRLPVIVLAVVLAAGAAYFLAARQPDVYRADATLLFRDSNVSQLVTGVATGSPGTPERNAATNLGLISLNTVATRTATRLGGDWTPTTVSENISSAAAGQSDLVTVSGTAGTASEAARLANTYADTFARMRRAGARDQIEQAREQVLAELDGRRLTSARRKQLTRDSDELRLLASLQDGSVQLAQSAIEPSTPAEPRPRRSAVLGALIGLLIGTALAFLLEQFDRRLRRPLDAERAFGLPVLASIGRGGAKHQQLDPETLPRADADAYQRLRASLPHLRPGSEIQTIAVTAAEAGSGKSGVAAHLAAAAAAAHVRALLIEADSRSPGLRELLDADAGADGDALPVVLRGEGTSLETSVTRIPLNGDPDVSFDAVLAGAEPRAGADLLDSTGMRSLLEEATENYDLVILDVPPVTHVTDAVSLLRQVDGVVIVARLGRDSKDRAEQLTTVLKHLDVRPLGVVTTFARRRDSVREHGVARSR